VIRLRSRELSQSQLFLDFEVKEDQGAEACDILLRNFSAFTFINFGRQREQATMKPRETSASVQSPMKSPLRETSACEMTEVIFMVKAIRMADAAHALCYCQYWSRVLLMRSDLQQASAKQESDE
jgi:hypothetical protein